MTASSSPPLLLLLLLLFSSSSSSSPPLLSSSSSPSSLFNMFHRHILRTGFIQTVRSLLAHGLTTNRPVRRAVLLVNTRAPGHLQDAHLPPPLTCCLRAAPRTPTLICYISILKSTSSSLQSPVRHFAGLLLSVSSANQRRAPMSESPIGAAIPSGGCPIKMLKLDE